MDDRWCLDKRNDDDEEEGDGKLEVRVPIGGHGSCLPPPKEKKRMPSLHELETNDSPTKPFSVIWCCPRTLKSLQSQSTIPLSLPRTPDRFTPDQPKSQSQRVGTTFPETLFAASFINRIVRLRLSRHALPKAKLFKISLKKKKKNREKKRTPYTYLIAKKNIISSSLDAHYRYSSSTTTNIPTGLTLPIQSPLPYY